MTINPSRTAELSINDIVRAAWVMAGCLNRAQTMDQSRGEWGRTLLETITKNLEAEGIQVRARDFVNVSLVAGTDRYTLTSDVLDVIGDGAYIRAGEANVNQAAGETLIKLISATTWQELASKNATGNPTMIYPHRFGAQVEARLWPVPAEAGTMRLEVQRLYPDSSDGNATPGLERPWAQYFIHELGSQIAESEGKSADKVTRLSGKARGLKEMCKGFSAQRADSQIYVDC